MIWNAYISGKYCAVGLKCQKMSVFSLAILTFFIQFSWLILFKSRDFENISMKVTTNTILRSW